ncbi:hypothetical protein PENSPDRAFT_201524 [Peniophora sp. CONT]|nr:hypothetical protein PENSPDRAFT_201524 [Peniophora sp. CONT]
MPLIRCKFYNDRGDPRTPGQHCPHRVCGHVHPSDGRWTIAQNHDEEIAKRVNQENRERDDALKAKLAPVRPPGQLFVDPQDLPQTSDVAVPPSGTDEEQAVESSTAPGWDSEGQDGWPGDDAAGVDAEPAGWATETVSRGWGDVSAPEDVEMRDSLSDSGMHSHGSPAVAPAHVNSTVNSNGSDGPAVMELDDAPVAKPAVEQSSTPANSIDNVRAYLRLVADFAVVASKAPDESIEFNIAGRLQAKAVVAPNDYVHRVATGGQLQYVNSTELIVQHEQLQDRDRCIRQNDDTIRGLIEQLAQTFAKRNELTVSSRAHRLANDAMELTFGEESVKDYAVERTQVFGTRDERLGSTISENLLQTVSSCAVPAMKESLASTDEFIEQLQRASSANLPAVEAAKQLMVSSSQFDTLFASIFKVGTV